MRAHPSKVILAIFFSLLAVVLLANVTLQNQIVAQKMSEEEKIKQINKMIEEKGYHWTAGKTSVSGLSDVEKKNLLGLKPPPEEWLKSLPVFQARENLVLNPYFDWRVNGGTTPAKNQGSCGSCWAFAAVGQLEGHLRIYDGRIEDLSEQQIIDCNTWGAGCNGGWVGAAYEIFQNPGAVRESCIPYQAADGFPCKQDQCQVIGRISGHQYIPNNINSLKQALLDGPVATAMTVVDNFYYYTGGCYETDTNDPTNHAVLLVGWDDNACAGQGAWIVKNSWGENWGENGFFYIKYGACNIGTSSYQISYIPGVIYVRVDSPNGGETWPSGTQQVITWTTQRETPDSISIYLSIDGGENYDHTIVTGLTGVNSYTWTVPELPVRTARIKVVAYFDGSIAGYDMSDNNFTIKGKPYRYVAKNGGNIYPYSLPQWAAQKIQDAIDAADVNDTILVAEGDYLEAVTIQDPPVYLYGGWDTTFTVRDPETYQTTIHISAGSVVSFVSTSDGTYGIEGFKIYGGAGTMVSIPTRGLYGGGIFAYQASPIIKGNIIMNAGSAPDIDHSGGGGIACYDGTVVIENNTISSCTAQCGSGIYLHEATATIKSNTISECHGNSFYNGKRDGGAIYASNSTITMEKNLIEDQYGIKRGGGLYLYFSQATMTQDTIRQNTADSEGGGVEGYKTAITMRHCQITGNTSDFGAGIYIRAENVNLENNIFTGNACDVVGGAIYADSIGGLIANNTIDRNTAGIAGGNLYIGLLGETLTIKNNIISYGIKNGIQAQPQDNLLFSYNNCFGNTPSNVAGITADSTNISGNPQYVDTLNWDYHLGLHSMSIDAGDPSDLDPDGSRADQGAFGGANALFDAPTFVSNLTATSADDTTIVLRWDKLTSPDIVSYTIYADTTSGFQPSETLFVASVSAAQDSFIHSPVAGCWYYKVSALNSNGYAGGYSNEASACASGPDLIAPEVTVIYPNGGEVIETGDTIPIQWIATDNIVETIAHGIPNDSTYDWVVPSLLSDSCLIKVIAYDPGKLTGEDTSDSLFSIKDYTAIDEDDSESDEITPKYTFSLEQNYPNPFNGTTTILYSVGKSAFVEIKIYDTTGRLVKVLEAGEKAPGKYSVVWRGKDNKGQDVASGVYFCRIKAGKFRQTRKIIYLR